MRRIFFLVGFGAILSQIMIIRELLNAFYGNEVAISAFLAGWLILTGSGSFFTGRVLQNDRIAGILLILLVALSGILIPFEIALIRTLRLILLDQPGEAAPFSLLFLGSLLCLFPLCFSLGSLFSVGCRVFGERRSGEAASSIYILEGAGALLGGMGFSYIFFRVEPLLVALLLSLLNLLGSLFLCRFLERGRFRFFLSLVLFTLFAFLFLFTLSPYRASFDEYLKNLKFPGEVLLVSKEHRFGNFSVTSSKGQFNFYQSGQGMGSTGDRLAPEEFVHIPLLHAESPRDLLLVGGGLEGVVKEALKHGAERIHYAELDPLALPIGMEYIEPEERRALEDPSVTLHLEADGRRVLRTFKESLDGILLGVGPPASALVNRFFTVEFFGEVRDALRPGGIFAFPLTAANGYIGPEHAELLRTIHRSLSEAFPAIRVLKADFCGILFLASPSGEVLELDAVGVLKRLEERRIRNRWVTRENLSHLLDPRREELLGEVFREEDSGKEGFLNRDLWPLGYFLYLDFWEARFSGVGKKPFTTLLKRGFWELTVIVFLAFLGILFLERAPHRKHILSVPGTLLISGFTGLAFETFLIFSFQSFFGYLYEFIGLIITSFMFGLVLGSMGVKRRLSSISRGDLLLIGLQGLLLLLCLGTPWVLHLLKEMKGLPLASWIFPLLNLAAGFIVGAEFPLANHVLASRRKDWVKIAGTLYGSDLFGASLGALTTGVVLIPFLGISGGLRAVALLNLLTIVLLACARVGRGRA